MTSIFLTLLDVFWSIRVAKGCQKNLGNALFIYRVNEPVRKSETWIKRFPQPFNVFVNNRVWLEASWPRRIWRWIFEDAVSPRDHVPSVSSGFSRAMECMAVVLQMVTVFKPMGFFCIPYVRMLSEETKFQNPFAFLVAALNRFVAKSMTTNEAVWRTCWSIHQSSMYQNISIRKSCRKKPRNLQYLRCPKPQVS